MTQRAPESPWQIRMDFGRQPPEELASLYPVKRGLIADFDQREGELGRFVRRVQERVTVRSPADVAHYFIQQIFVPWEEFSQEEIYTLMLNNKNQTTHTAMIYRGTVNAVYLRTAEVFRPAIINNASSIIMAHQHPSGNPEPSPEDIRASNQIFEAGRLLDIDVLDSLIIGDGTFVSLKERGLLGV